MLGAAARAAASQVLPDSSPLTTPPSPIGAAAGRPETLSGLVTHYRASPDWSGLADTTRKHWSRWLDRIAATAGELDIGGLSFRALDDRRVQIRGA